VPFAVEERHNSKFAVVNSQTVATVTAEIAPAFSKETDQSDFSGRHTEFIEENPFDKENPFVQETFKSETVEELSKTENGSKRGIISAEFLDTITMKLPSISAEELEHIEDNWLDTAYESKLLREGDNLFPIINAAKIAETLLGGNKSQRLSANAESANNNSADSIKEKPSFVMPVFDAEEDSGDIPPLPENPTEEQLLNYAHNHPLVKKAMRIFRAKIVGIKKLDGAQNFLEQSKRRFV
jgi:hypothetical protein